MKGTLSRPCLRFRRNEFPSYLSDCSPLFSYLQVQIARLDHARMHVLAHPDDRSQNVLGDGFVFDVGQKLHRHALEKEQVGVIVRKGSRIRQSPTLVYG